MVLALKLLASMCSTFENFVLFFILPFGENYFVYFVLFLPLVVDLDFFFITCDECVCAFLSGRTQNLPLDVDRIYLVT